MRRLIGISLATILMLSVLFILPGFTQGTKESDDLYTIKKGDTLWDISAKFLKDPFLWPKLWQRNPYITNPHWIYPGNPIRLSTLEPIKKEEPKPEPKEVVAEKPKEAAKEPEIKKEEPPPVIEKKPEIVAEAKPEPIKVEEKIFGFPDIRSAGFMSDMDFKGIGVVLESKEGKNLMSGDDIIYLAFKTSGSVLIGDKYTIFRASEEIKHPVTEKRVGRRYNVIGNVQIIDQHGHFFTAKIIESFDAVQKGDLIQPYSKAKMEGVIGK
ncbi:MAG: LysM peptidoglycan-binding domain-containing protein [Syntrophaceae bacterium]|nr:LysM peptidoglycan-binding domain-containing protein [Syntrophaceae bacterium]